jgi:hypothetical protein
MRCLPLLLFCAISAFASPDPSALPHTVLHSSDNWVSAPELPWRAIEVVVLVELADTVPRWRVSVASLEGGVADDALTAVVERSEHLLVPMLIGALRGTPPAPRACAPTGAAGAAFWELAVGCALLVASGHLLSLALRRPPAPPARVVCVDQDVSIRLV